MTFAWYGHLKKPAWPLWFAILSDGRRSRSCPSSVPAVSRIACRACSDSPSHAPGPPSASTNTAKPPSVSPARMRPAAPPNEIGGAAASAGAGAAGRVEAPARLGEDQGAHPLREPPGDTEGHVAPARVADEADRTGPQPRGEGGHVLGVPLRAVAPARAVPALGPVAAQAHRDRSVMAPERRHLRRPEPEVGQRPVHEEQRGSRALLDVSHLVAVDPQEPHRRRLPPPLQTRPPLDASRTHRWPATPTIRPCIARRRSGARGVAGGPLHPRGLGRPQALKRTRPARSLAAC